MGSGSSIAEVTCRELRPEDTEAVLELMRLGLGARVPRRPELWHWKHRANPFGKSFGLLAEAGDQPVALRMFLRWCFRGQGRTITAARAVDTVTHPAWQGRGLFTRLTRRGLGQLEASGVALVFNTPNRKSRPGYLKLGWRGAGRLPLMVRVLRPLRLPIALLTRSRETNPQLDLAGFCPAKEWLTSSEVESFGRGGIPESRWQTPRSAAYLRWRYGDVPGFRYAVLEAARRGGRAAVIFRGRPRRGLREIDVAEVLADGSKGGIGLAVALLDELAHRCDADSLVAVACPGTPERLALRRAGFVPARWLAPPLTVRPLPRREWELPRTVDSWCWSLGDLEIF